MGDPNQKNLRVVFRPFEASLSEHELYKGGRRLHLQDQPFRLLVMLLERPGEVVSREEVRQRLWPDGHFVDFNEGIDTAVRKLRYALGDSATTPRFIETVPRRGYRFIAPIESAQPDIAAAALPVPHLDRGRSRWKLAAVTSAIIRKPERSRWQRIGATAGLVVVLLAAIVSIWWIQVRRGHGSGARMLGGTAIRSLAVLPLENLSGDAEQEYFADGMTDELITDLGQIGTLRVISRTSAMQYKGIHKPLLRIGKELNVDAVVEGTVVRSGDRVRITAQLIEVPTEKHLWARSYEGDVRNVLGLQNQVASSIADQIQITLTEAQRTTLESARVVNPKAHELYLKGQYYSEKDVDRGFQKGIELFNEALQQQPDLALAYVGKANAYVRLGHTLALPPEQAFPQAKAAALKALAIDDDISEAHTALGQVEFLYDWNFAAAEGEFRRALLLNPNSTSAQTAYASLLNATGRPEESIARARRALDIDPVSMSAMIALCAQLYWARRYDEAIEEATKALEMDPTRVQSHFCLGVALEQKREFPEAIAQLEKAVELSHDKWGMAFVAHARAMSGDKAGARKILADMERFSSGNYVSPWWRAIVYPDLGDKEKAFYWLEKAYQGREHDLVFSRVWPMFDSLRGDPRYQDFMRRVGLPE